MFAILIIPSHVLYFNSDMPIASYDDIITKQAVDQHIHRNLPTYEWAWAKSEI